MKTLEQLIYQKAVEVGIVPSIEAAEAKLVWTEKDFERMGVSMVVQCASCGMTISAFSARIVRENYLSCKGCCDE